MIIPFGEWLPDQPAYGNMCVTATNVRPKANGYGPFLGANVFSNALADTVRGRISFRQPGGKRETFVGTETGLYRLNGPAWDDVTPSAGVSNTEKWRFVPYGSRLIATNGEDDPLKFDLASDTEFSTLTNAPKHTFPIVVRNVLVALDLKDGSGDQIAFSAVNDSESWTVLAGGGTQRFFEGGPVIGGTGGEFGIVLQSDGIVRMNFVGGDLRFTFDRIEGGVGCSDAESIVSYRGGAFYLSGDGFQYFDGAQSRNISEQKVAQTFYDGLLASTLVTESDEVRVTKDSENRIVNAGNVVHGSLDPENSSVVWSYPASGGRKLIIYNYNLDRWSEVNADISFIHAAARPNSDVLAGFNTSNELVLFDGAQLTATVSTGDVQIAKDRRAMITSARGLVDAAHDITLTKKQDLADTGSTTQGSSNSQGKCSVRSLGRYQRVQVSPTADFTELTGAELEVRNGPKV